MRKKYHQQGTSLSQMTFTFMWSQGSFLNPTHDCGFRGPKPCVLPSLFMGKHCKWWGLSSLPLVNWVTARINESEILKEKKIKIHVYWKFQLTLILRISIMSLGEVSIRGYFWKWYTTNLHAFITIDPEFRNKNKFC